MGKADAFTYIERRGEGPLMQEKTHKGQTRTLPAIQATYAQTGASTTNNELGMRPMQERACEKRGEQYLLIKSPPASGKSRALMFIALDKIHNQRLKQALIIVPERSIGASFHNEPLKKFGFYWDWNVEPQWNLCDHPGTDGSKVKSVERFLQSDDTILICTHATFRFAFDKLGAEAFDDRVLAIDEFHHVSAGEDNKLGAQVSELMERDKIHMVAMTGSYFRGDAVPVLSPEDEARFETVTYTYYEQLNGYTYLKNLNLGYVFYQGLYSEALTTWENGHKALNRALLNPDEKTILHIPNVNSKESTRDKYEEVNVILDALGEFQETDEETGFYLIKLHDSDRIVRVADLVTDDAPKRDKVAAALRSPQQKEDRDFVDIIIALGMAKEGFDWIWCEHALTVGYRSSLTEIIQIIGRTTRDAPGKHSARFTNLIAEPDASEATVSEAVNGTLKAIAASLLMEQVLAPVVEFRTKRRSNAPTEGYDYGDDGYKEGATNVGYNPESGKIQVEIDGLAEPKSEEAKRICREDITELISSFVQDPETVERGTYDTNLMAPELNQVKMAKIIKAKYPQIHDEEDREAIRQRAVAALQLAQRGNQIVDDVAQDTESTKQTSTAGPHTAPLDVKASTAFVDNVRKFVLDVRELSVDLIDQINPFADAYAITAKTMNEDSLKQIQAVISSKKGRIDPEEAKMLAERARRFQLERGRPLNKNASDPWEQHLIRGVTAFMNFDKQGHYDKQKTP